MQKLGKQRFTLSPASPCLILANDDFALNNKKSNIEEIEQKIADSDNHHHGRIACLAIISPRDLFIRHPLIIRYGNYIGRSADGSPIPPDIGPESG